MSSSSDTSFAEEPRVKLSKDDSNNLPEEVSVMQIILRFLQLLCENHNSELQNYLRIQSANKNSYNLVCETLQFLGK